MPERRPGLRGVIGGSIGQHGLAVALVLALGLPLAGGAFGQTTPAAPTGQLAPAADPQPAAPTDAAPTTAPDAAPAAGGAVAKSGGFGLTKSQTSASAPGGASKGGKTISVLPSDAKAPDYAAWERVAVRAETSLAGGETSNKGLELLRGQLVDWRNVFTGTQNANATRIATLRDQITALGPAPSDGTPEADEIAQRRATLAEQLVRLQAPGIAAEEAWRRADGLIGEIDRVLRERQTSELMKLAPSPANPANWGQALVALGQISREIGAEAARNWAREDKQAGFRENLPAVLLLLVVAVALVWRGRRWIETQAWRLQAQATARGRRVWGFLASLGQVVVPVVGVVLAVSALVLTEIPGTLGEGLLLVLPGAGTSLFLAWWLGGRVFPPGEVPPEWTGGTFSLPPERRAEGRALATSFGVLLAGYGLIEGVFTLRSLPEAARAVIQVPLLAATGFVLWRMGQMLSRHVAQARPEGEASGFRERMVALLGRAAMVIGVVGPLAGLVGYVNAASALIYPAVASLGLIALIVVVQELVEDIHVLILRIEGDSLQQSLVPVLAGFALVLMSLPLFALIWGARPDDLMELWQRFRQGVAIGDTRISPSNFLWFVVLFGLGYGVTKAFQGALKTTILPKTRLDQGGQTALISGVGYLGIFIAGLIAFSGAGIDLSGLAFIAGALSLGIGFGLQNIVQNFVSGIILLIERPVSEGDWIEVGTVSGTVKAISVRSTRIQTFDRSDVIVPNADLVTQRVTNWTRFNLTGRLIVPVMVVHGSDVARVTAVLRAIAEEQPMAVLNPAPVVALMGFTLEGISFEMRVILRDVNFQLSVRDTINRLILERFAAEGIVMAHSEAGAHPAGWRPAAAVEAPVAEEEAEAGADSAPSGKRKRRLAEEAEGSA